MASKVGTRLLYRHPKTHQLISQQAASRYFKRTKKRIRPEHWLYVTAHFSKEELTIKPDMLPREIAAIQKMKRRNGRIEHAKRLLRTEKIMKASTISDRWVSKILGKHRVYKKLVENIEGAAACDACRTS